MVREFGLSESIDKQIAEMKAAFESYGDKITTAMGVGVYAACLLVAGVAKRKAPVRFGLLKGSITQIVKEHGDKAIGYVGTVVEYAAFQEFGTSKMAPHPFLTPAVNENKKQIRDKIKEEIARVLK